MIPFWSDTNPKVKEILLPTEDTNWSELSFDDKKNMWKYLEYHFFNPNPKQSDSIFHQVPCSYKFYGDNGWENDRLAELIWETVNAFNEKYKKKSYAHNFLEDFSFNSACYDFYRIFMEEDMDVVFEMLILYGRMMVVDNAERIRQQNEESEEDFEKRKEEDKWLSFDRFAKRLSEVFVEFGINYTLTRQGFIVADEPMIIEKIYEPVLQKLSSRKWADVNRDLRDAFSDLNDDKDGSGALTHILAALQGFLQIQVYGTTGKGDTATLIREAIEKGLIPDDDFSKQVVLNMNSFWAKERQEKGDPHPKKQYATKDQAKLVISLVMVFIDHVL